jgi:small subunit ribosomal protein S7
MSETKVAASAVASKKADKAPKKEKKAPFTSPFSYADELQAKFVNCIMKNGKKTVAQRILKDTFTELNRRGVKDVEKAFVKAFENTTPTIEVKPKRIGGAVYQIPREVKPQRQRTLAIRWILEGARSRKGQPMFKRLASELMEASEDNGFAVNRKKEVHRMAQANKAFAHLARY